MLENGNEKIKSNKVYFPVLVTDIGGTNSRMRIIKVSTNYEDELILIDCKKLPSKDFKSLEDLLKSYLEPFKGTENFPIIGVVALPGPIIDNKCEVAVNLLHWGISDGDKVAKSCGIKEVHLLNDFVVNGYGMLSGDLVLNKDYFILQKGQNNNNEDMEKLNLMNSSDPIAVVGPGTGLGHAIGMRRKGDKYHQIYPSEGGHQVFLAHTQREWDFRQYIATKKNIKHISHERGLSGPAIPIMFNYFIDIEKMEPKLLDPKSEDFEIKRWKLTAEEIVISANKGDCPVTQEVRTLFTQLLGTCCSNISIFTLPLSGLFIVGSISNSFKDFLRNDSTFLDRFLDKGRLKDFMKAFPIYLIVDTNIGLKGSGEYARRIIENKIINENGGFC